MRARTRICPNKFNNFEKKYLQHIFVGLAGAACRAARECTQSSGHSSRLYAFAVGFVTNPIVTHAQRVVRGGTWEQKEK